MSEIGSQGNCPAKQKAWRDIFWKKFHDFPASQRAPTPLQLLRTSLPILDFPPSSKSSLATRAEIHTNSRLINLHIIIILYFANS